MKQYLLMCDDTVMPNLQALFKGIQCLEVQGLNVDATNRVQVLATPVIPTLSAGETTVEAVTPSPHVGEDSMRTPLSE